MYTVCLRNHEINIIGTSLDVARRGRRSKKSEKPSRMICTRTVALSKAKLHFNKTSTLHKVAETKYAVGPANAFRPTCHGQRTAVITFSKFSQRTILLRLSVIGLLCIAPIRTRTRFMILVITVKRLFHRET